MLTVKVQINSITRALEKKQEKVTEAFGASIENGARGIVTGRGVDTYTPPISLAMEAERLKATPATIKKDMEKLRAAYVYSGGGKRRLTRFQSEQFVGAKKKVFEERKKRIGYTRDTLEFDSWGVARMSRAGSLQNRGHYIDIQTGGKNPRVEFRSRQSGLLAMHDKEGTIRSVANDNIGPIANMALKVIGAVI